MMMKQKTILLIIATVIITTYACNSTTNREHKISVGTTVTTENSYSFKNPETEKLSIAAFELRKNGDYNQSISVYKQAIQLEPDNPKLFFDISECYWRMNMADEAIASLDKAILIDDSSTIFYNNLGLIYWQLYKDEKAIENFEKAIKLDSTNWVQYSNLAMAYNSNGEQQKACVTFNKAKELGLDDQTINNTKHLAIIKQRCE
jgi:tetratricopeptide (TPR) repeat protein